MELTYIRGGYNKKGFNFSGIHRDTGTKYDPEGYDEAGYDSDGYDKDGYNKRGYDRDGYNRKGYDSEGFFRDGVNAFTAGRYDRWGYDKDGYNRKGFNNAAIHRDTGTQYDPEGYDKYGFGQDGYDRDGYDRDGVNKEGYNREGYDRRGANRQGYTVKGLHIDGYDENGYDANGYDKNGNDINGINRITGKVDKRIKIAQKIIEEDLTIEQFCKKYSLPMEEVKAAINAIRETPCVKQQLDKVLASHANKYVSVLHSTANAVLTGKMKITEARNIQEVIRISSEGDREKLTNMLMSAITSHEIGIMEYARMFGKDVEYSRLPKYMVEVLSGMKKTAGPRTREMYKEIDRVKAYQQPYRAIDGERMGYLAKPTDKAPTMVDITDTERDLARDYLRASGEYICNKTMQATLMKVIKGEIDESKIERIRKETRLRELQQQAKELDIQLQQTGQVVGNE